ncbi:cytokinin riboside 5'-monophosphate phosphoribohydrolase [Pseudovibrio japonicus]|uniref:Cytokinin riboside 5'-monophosphate phosphoribohydrolase n=1 Tax=Pseudovibrio japonicus TaxID=366534 RepID=A0ABQ3DXV1_9HYPH|nr:TIGR00730 family Rossman fold protein [Pseudovibrio japonicus]GHB19822.1 cytokinin riboside 5'-monophosphate phosphoribohydrolase [Pseudovibrio japonicus]
MGSICVFCGSSTGKRPEYETAARLLGTEIAKRGNRLVYGGAEVGLMGIVADAALEAGGEVVGVLPEALAVKELAHKSLTSLHIVGSMHERKAMMADMSDAFVALPGGLGTMEELFEVWTWGQLGYHKKPCALYNANGFYGRMLAYLDFIQEEAFMKKTHRDMLVVGDNPAQLLDQIETYEAPSRYKWITRAET